MRKWAENSWFLFGWKVTWLQNKAPEQWREISAETPRFIRVILIIHRMYATLSYIPSTHGHTWIMNTFTGYIVLTIMWDTDSCMYLYFLHCYLGNWLHNLIETVCVARFPVSTMHEAVWSKPEMQEDLPLLHNDMQLHMCISHVRIAFSLQ